MSHLTPRRLVEAVRHKLSSHPGRDLVAFWYQVQGDRNQFAEEVRRCAGDFPLVPLLPSGGFNDANAITQHLCRLITDSRASFEPPLFTAPRESRPLVLLLLSRSPFTAGQFESPAVLPAWFPARGGLSTKVWIEDLFWTAQGQFHAPEAQIEELCERLYDLDRALVGRLRRVYDQSRHAGNALFESIRVESKSDKKGGEAPAGEKYADFLDGANSFLRNEVRAPEGFRPSARDAKSMVGRLMRLASKTSPDELTRRAEGLARALDLPLAAPPRPDDSLVTVLFRSTNPVSDPATLFARNLIVTVFAASQFVTAAAHADSYPEYPLILLQGLSFNLRQSLDKLSQCLEEWPLNTGSVASSG